MTEIPQPGTGSVSLNVATTNTVAPEPAPPTTTEQPEVHEDKSKGAISIPVLDDEEDNIEVADLQVNADGSVGLFQQKSIKLWGSIFGVALVVLIGVFFFLARQTTLFQGSVTQQTPGDDEVIVTDPNFDSSSEGNLTPPGSDDLPVNSDENPLVLPTVDPAPDDAPIVNDDFDSLLDDFEDNNTPSDFDFSDFDSTQDPEFDDNIFVDIPGGSSDITPTPDPTPTPTPTPTPVVTIPPTQPTNTNPPSLVSNTNPEVLGSAQVQGNTGPGVLIYFLPPLATFLIRRKYVR